MSEGVAVLDDPEQALVAMDPVRARILALLSEGEASAAGLSGRLSLARQKVGYHLNLLEKHGLVVETSTRKHGGLTERLFRASATSYLVSPAAMGPSGADPGRIADRLSVAYALALAGRVIRELAQMGDAATKAKKRLPTLSIDADIRFRSAEERADFAEDLSAAVRALARKYHDERHPGGRWYRLTVLAHPRPSQEPKP